MTYEEFNHWAGGIESLATVGVDSRRILDLHTIHKDERKPRVHRIYRRHQRYWQAARVWIVELVAYLENKGKVHHKFHDLRFDLEGAHQACACMTRSLPEARPREKSFLV
jgi:hypothetical protein